MVRCVDLKKFIEAGERAGKIRIENERDADAYAKAIEDAYELETGQRISHRRSEELLRKFGGRS